MDQLWIWIAFNLFVLAMLAVDLLVFHKEAHEVSLKEAAIERQDRNGVLVERHVTVAAWRRAVFQA